MKQNVHINICQDEMSKEQSISPCALDHIRSHYIVIHSISWPEKIEKYKRDQFKVLSLEANATILSLEHSKVLFQQCSVFTPIFQNCFDNIFWLIIQLFWGH